MKTNQNNLVQIALQAAIAYPLRFGAFESDSCGHGHAVPSVGGITYNVRIGDKAFGWVGDHIEPGVSALLSQKERSSRESKAVQFLACVGNKAVLVSGKAKGTVGTVAGHHGGVEHLIIDFPKKVLQKLTYDDKIMIHSCGQGLMIDGAGDTKIYNTDPSLLQPWGVKQNIKGQLQVPVALIVPAALMGSGIGNADPGSGDYDITTQDEAMVKRLGIDKLRFGDFVAIEDADNTYGRNYFEGAMTIGIVVHSDSFLSGHGPGVTTLMSSKKGFVQPILSKKANLADVLGIGSSSRQTSTKSK
ncbi:MAG: hypothetical protein ACI9CF_001959 [Candidatus Omnitrophota bacterium]|jgi:hypothetical protein